MDISWYYDAVFYKLCWHWSKSIQFDDSIFGKLGFETHSTGRHNYHFIFLGNFCYNKTSIHICASTSKICLSIFAAIVGGALGPLFGNFVMWLEQHLIVDAKVNALITIFGSIGGSVIPTLASQLIIQVPMFLMYLIFGLSISLMLLFGASYYLGRKIKRI